MGRDGPAPNLSISIALFNFPISGSRTNIVVVMILWLLFDTLPNFFKILSTASWSPIVMLSLMWWLLYTFRVCARSMRSQDPAFPQMSPPLGCMVTPCLNPNSHDTPALCWKVRVGPQGWLSWAAFEPLDPCTRHLYPWSTCDREHVATS